MVGMTLTPAHRRHAATHHGVFTLDQARALGATDDRISHARRAGELIHPRRGVVVLGGVAASYEQAVAIGCAAHPLAVASHRTVGRLIGLRRIGPAEDVEVTVQGRCGVRLPGLVVHHSKWLPRSHVVERADGIRHTTVARTVFDLASVLGDDALESVIEQVLDRRLATISTLAAMGRTLRERGRNGSARFGRVLASRPAWRRPANSDLEVRFDQALRRLGMAGAVRRPGIALADGSEIHPDLWWPDLRLAVEVDHVSWHGGRLDAQYDKKRDRRAARLGVQTVRVTDAEIAADIWAAANDVVAIAALRRAA